MIIKVPLSWLREYVDIPWSVKELAGRLTMAGLEVDGIAGGHGEQDAVLSLDVTTNRSDCLSITGVAREVAALTRQPLRLPDDRVEEAGAPVNELGSVTVQDVAGCPRFVGRVIQRVKIAPSPPWLAHRLEAAGIRPINNVVDVTNYVMLEMGQPLHAYDLDRLAGHAIIVRRAENGATFTTLDGVERTLTDEILMIADQDSYIGVAGVMGGLNTEITAATTRVFLEGACFDAVRVRRGARRLGMETDASRRFERGVDPERPGRAVARAAQLIADLAGGDVAVGAIDVRQPVSPSPPVRLHVDRVNRLLGTDIRREDMVEILKALQFTVREEEDLLIHVPSFRPDVTREADLIEEIARLYGYDRIEPVTSSPGPQRLDGDEEAGRIDRESRQRWREQAVGMLRETLIGCGCTEVMTHSLTHPDTLKRIDPETVPLVVSNPISLEYSAMRTTLAAPVLDVVRRNLNRKVFDIRIFEIGRVFIPVPGQLLPQEALRLCVALTGRQAAAHWSRPAGPVDFFDLKGLVEHTLTRFGLDNVRSVPYDDREILYDPEQAASLMAGDRKIGAYGAVAQSVLTYFDLKEPVWLYQLDCEYLIRMEPPKRLYRAQPKYPAVERDLAIVVPEPATHESIVDAIRDCGGALLEAISLFDVYRGAQIPAGKKSLAYTLRFRAADRTLTDEEVAAIQTNVLKRLSELFGAELRAGSPVS